MRIHNIYADANGESHIRDLDIEWARSGPMGKISDPVPVLSMAFRVTDGSYDLAQRAPAPIHHQSRRVC